jgi:hypothetical protein
VTDAVANLLAFVPSLGTREVVAFGEGLPLPTRLRFTELPPDRVPRSETFRLEDWDEAAQAERGFVRQVVERWRGAAGGSRIFDEAPLVAPEPLSPPAKANPSFMDGDSATARLEQLRAQLLKRPAGAT